MWLFVLRWIVSSRCSAPPTVTLNRCCPNSLRIWFDCFEGCSSDAFDVAGGVDGRSVHFRAPIRCLAILPSLWQSSMESMVFCLSIKLSNNYSPHSMQIWEIQRAIVQRSTNATEDGVVSRLMHEENIYVVLHMLLIFWVPAFIVLVRWILSFILILAWL